MSKEPEDTPKYKQTPSFLRAKTMLPEERYDVFDELVGDYKFAAFKHHGKEWASPRVIAELVLAGWRCSAPEIPSQERHTE